MATPRLRVLFDCSVIRRGGGVQVSVDTLVSASQDTSIQGLAVVTAQVAREASLIAERLEMIIVPESEQTLPGLITWMFKLARIERTFAPDAVFTVFGPSYWFPQSPHVMGFAIPSLIYPERLVGRQATGVQHVVDAIRRALARRPESILVETETVSERASAIIGIESQRIQVIPNTFSVAFQRQCEQLVRRKPDGRTVLVPSSYYRHKNLEVIPEVAAAVQRMGHPDIRFVLTLPVTSKNWEDISGRAAQLSVASMISSVGHVPNAMFAELYRKASCVFLPTLLECSTAVYPEAFLAETPLITSDLDFARDLCGNAALFVDPCNPQLCAEAIVRVFEDTQLRATLVAAGKRVLKSRYTTPEDRWRAQRAALESAAQLRFGQ